MDILRLAAAEAAALLDRKGLDKMVRALWVELETMDLEELEEHKTQLVVTLILGAAVLEEAQHTL
jgi:hypothetical protein